MTKWTPEYRREYMRAWHAAHPGYSSAASKARRKDGRVRVSPITRARNKESNLAYQRRRRNWLAQIKLERGCEFVQADGSVCGWREHPAALDFNHRDPASKLFGIGSNMLASYDALMAEIAKCDVLCANHHRILSVTERHYIGASRVPVEDHQLALFEESA